MNNRQMLLTGCALVLALVAGWWGHALLTEGSHTEEIAEGSLSDGACPGGVAPSTGRHPWTLPTCAVNPASLQWEWISFLSVLTVPRTYPRTP